MSEDTNQMIKLLENNGDLFEVSKVTTYHGVRKRKNRNLAEVEVNIFDSGEAAGNTRYFITAHLLDDPDVVAAGNPASTIDITLATLHWSNLD